MDSFAWMVLLIIIGVPVSILGIVYLNKNSSLANTKTSPPRYSHDTYRNRRPLIKAFVIAKDLPQNYIVLDLETTGLDPCCDEIIEIGAIKYENHVECGRFSTFIKPSFPVPVEATQINHITNHMLANAPTFEQMTEDLVLFIMGFTLIAHNAKFDLSFLQSSLGYQLPNKVIDTLALAKQNLVGLDNYKLETIKRHYKMTGVSHRAIGDCLVTAKLYKECFENNYNTHFSDVRDSHISQNQITDVPLEGISKEVNDIIIEILKQTGKNYRNISARVFSDGVQLFYKDVIPVWYYKFGGRLKYWLVWLPFEKVTEIYKGTLKITPDIKSGIGDDGARVFVTSPNDLFKFKDVIIQSFDHAVQLCVGTDIGSLCTLCGNFAHASKYNSEYELCNSCMLAMEGVINTLKIGISNFQVLANEENDPEKRIFYLNEMNTLLHRYKKRYYDKGIDVLDTDVNEMIAEVDSCIADAYTP